MIYQKCPYCGAENTEEELERNNYRCTCCGAKIPYETHVVKYVEKKQNSNIGKYIIIGIFAIIIILIICYFLYMISTTFTAVPSSTNIPQINSTGGSINQILQMPDNSDILANIQNLLQQILDKIM